MSKEIIKNNSDFLFLFDATNTNPNGDPDQENKPRMDQETKTLLVSDVRTKRTVRDFLSNKGYSIFVNTLNDKKVTMEMMFKNVMEKYEVEKDATSDEKLKVILDNMIDMRLFGSALAVDKITKTFTGPVQLGWGYSLHPVDLVKSNSIVTIMNDDSSTFGKMYKIHYALVAQSGTINKFAANKTGMTEDDKEIFQKAIIQSMMNELTHSKQGQQPLLYLEVVYKEKFDGYIGDLRRFLDVTYKDEAIRKMENITVDFSRLNEIIADMKKKDYIEDILVWTSSLVNKNNIKNIPQAKELDLLSPISIS